jgi:hypothetical protein
MADKLALELVQSPARQAHVLRAGSGIELRELPPQTGDVGGLNARLTAGSEQGFKALVGER